jgi:hypothetical protein
MGWVSSHKRHGARLALVALALQIVLSFGHVHLENLPLDGARAAHFAGVEGHHAALTQASRQAPAQNPGDADDYCAICASIFLASTSFASQPPPLPVPAGCERIAHSLDALFGTTEPRRFAFQSRAPPAA